MVYGARAERKRIALTFDDNTKVTPALATLRALEKDKVPATLFLIGSAVSGTSAINSEIIKGMNAGLFEVGDHTLVASGAHRALPSALARQIGGGVDAFHELTGARTVPLFRPPYGSTDAQVAAVAGKEGFRYLVLVGRRSARLGRRLGSTIADHGGQPRSQRGHRRDAPIGGPHRRPPSIPSSRRCGHMDTSSYRCRPC